MKNLSELKFSNSSELIRKMFLKEIAALDLQIYAVIIKKSLTKKKLKDELPVLYNYLTKILLEKILPEVNRKQKLIICLDKCMSPNQRNNLESYIKTEFFSLLNMIPDVNIIHEVSSDNQGLIVTDFAVGAFGYKYNTKALSKDSDKYTKVISKRIAAEKSDLFKKV